MALVLCIHAGVSELFAHDGWGPSSFPSRTVFSAFRNRGGITAAGAMAARSYVSLMTGVCEAGEGRDWRYTPIKTGHGRGAYKVKVGIMVAVTEGMFVSNRQVD